jgi:hypothetical protein
LRKATLLPNPPARTWKSMVPQPRIVQFILWSHYNPLFQPINKGYMVAQSSHNKFQSQARPSVLGTPCSEVVTLHKALAELFCMLGFLALRTWGGHSEPAPTSTSSTGCLLLLGCGWTSTELVYGYRSETIYCLLTTFHPSFMVWWWVLVHCGHIWGIIVHLAPNNGTTSNKETWSTGLDVGVGTEYQEQAQKYGIGSRSPTRSHEAHGPPPLEGGWWNSVQVTFCRYIYSFPRRLQV